MATLINGSKVASEIKEEVAEEILNFEKKNGLTYSRHREGSASIKIKDSSEKSPRQNQMVIILTIKKSKYCIPTFPSVARFLRFVSQVRKTIIGQDKKTIPMLIHRLIPPISEGVASPLIEGSSL